MKNPRQKIPLRSNSQKLNFVISIDRHPFPIFGNLDAYLMLNLVVHSKTSHISQIRGVNSGSSGRFSGSILSEKTLEISDRITQASRANHHPSTAPTGQANTAHPTRATTHTADTDTLAPNEASRRHRSGKSPDGTGDASSWVKRFQNGYRSQSVGGKGNERRGNSHSTGATEAPPQHPPIMRIIANFFRNRIQIPCVPESKRPPLLANRHRKLLIGRKSELAARIRDHDNRDVWVMSFHDERIDGKGCEIKRGEKGTPPQRSAARGGTDRTGSTEPSRAAGEPSKTLPGRVAPMTRSTDKHHRFPEPLFFRHRSRIDRIFISGVIDRPIFHACYQRAFVLELDRIRQEERAQVGQRQLAVSLRA